MKANNTWFCIAKAENKSADIDIYGEIGAWGISAKDFINNVKSKGELEDIYLNISSDGGSVFEGVAIYTFLKASKAKVHVRIDGVAASIASVIMLAGDDIIIGDSAMVMIHEPKAGVWGEEEDIMKTANMLAKVKKTMANIYSKKMNISEEEALAVMKAETWYTADEAVEAGLADSVFEGMKAAASFDFDKFGYKNVPEMLNTGVTGDKEANMSTENTPELPVIDKAYLAENCSAMLEEIQAEAKQAGYAEGLAEGAASERDRIKSVEEVALAGYEDVIQGFKYDGKTTKAEAAIAMLSKVKERGNKHHEALIADAQPVAEESLEEDATNKSPEAKWDKDEALRAEFGGNKNAYLAFNKAQEQGRVKILRGKE